MLQGQLQGQSKLEKTKQNVVPELSCCGVLQWNGEVYHGHIQVGGGGLFPMILEVFPKFSSASSSASFLR